MKEWNDNNKGKVFETRPLVRDMNVETSTHVFVGPYVDDNVCFLFIILLLFIYLLFIYLFYCFIYI